LMVQMTRKILLMGMSPFENYMTAQESINREML
jgi:hypothetical protein